MVYFCCICGTPKKTGQSSGSIYPPGGCTNDNMTGYVTGYRLGKSFDVVTPIAVNPPPERFLKKGLQVCPTHYKHNNPTTDEYRTVRIPVFIYILTIHWGFEGSCGKACLRKRSNFNSRSSSYTERDGTSTVQRFVICLMLFCLLIAI